MSVKDEISLVDYLIVILRRKRLIVVITIISALITAIVSLLMTPIYRAETRIMPPQSSSSGLAAQFLGGNLGSLAGGLVGIQTPSALYVDLIESRIILDNIIEKYELMKEYNQEYREDARRELRDRLLVKEEKKSGIISIAIEDKDPKRAADMANTFVSELKKLTKGLAISKAAQKRLFFEQQMEDARKTLLEVEDEMKRFQEKTGGLKIEDQAKAIIEGIADLRAKLAAKEVEIRALKAFLTENNPDLQVAEEQLKGMRIELKKLEAKGDQSYDPLIPSSRMPSIGIEYVRKLRELKYSETLLQLLSQQYEIARIDESQDAIIFQVIYEAIPPEVREKPKRSLMVSVASFAGFFLSVFVAFLIESIEKASNDPAHRDRVKTLKRYLSLKI